MTRFHSSRARAASQPGTTCSRQRFARLQAAGLPRSRKSARITAKRSYVPQPREVSMPRFLQQVAYTPEGWQTLIKNPQNRIDAVRPAIEKLGGKIETAWFAFGEYDVILIVEMPDNVSA